MKRIWGIRHVRYFFLKRELLRWFSYCHRHGWTIDPARWAHLDAVWEGRD